VGDTAVRCRSSGPDSSPKPSTSISTALWRSCRGPATESCCLSLVTQRCRLSSRH
jgi:hypothetical protein